jgi:hypothetical protein
MNGIDDISHSLGRLESKVDQLIDSQEKFADKFDRHDERLKSLEGHKNYILGVIAAASLLFSVAVEFVKARFLS